MENKPITKTLSLDRIDYFQTHLSIVNCLIPVKLTPKEIEVLACFMSFTGTLAEDRFSTTGKKIVRETLQISHQGLSNYMKYLSDSGFLIETNGRTEILPLLQPNIDQQVYMIKLARKS